MTFEQAADIISLDHIKIDLPGRQKKQEERRIWVQFADGTRRQKVGFVRKNLALVLYHHKWHVIHVYSENAIYESNSFEEAQGLVTYLQRKNIDLNWGIRDLYTFKSILQLIGARKRYIRVVEKMAAETSVRQVSATEPLEKLDPSMEVTNA